MSPTLWPDGFRISGKPVAASFAHPHSFLLQPLEVPRDETSIDSTMALGGRESGYANYWDENAAISELVFEVDETIQPTSKKSKEKKKERAKDATLKGQLALSDMVQHSSVLISLIPICRGDRSGRWSGARANCPSRIFGSHIFKLEDKQSC